MHYLTLVAVDIPEVKEEPEVDAAIKSAIEELKEKFFDEENDRMSSVQRDFQIERLTARTNAFARAVIEAVSEVMEPYNQNTEDRDYLEFFDMTDELEDEYQTGCVEMVRLPEGKYVFPYSRPFSDRYIVSEGKVLERNAGPCKHAMRTKRAKKMQVINRPFRKIYSSVKEYAEEHCGYVCRKARHRYGYYYNPDAFWDGYQIGGGWAYELLVKADCKDFSLGERYVNHNVPSAPAGYMWASAARKKDIAWDVMKDWNKHQELELFSMLEKAYTERKLPEVFFGNFTDNGIASFGNMLYICGETAEEYLKRKHIGDAKYYLRPYGFLDCDGWHAYSDFIHNIDCPGENAEEWDRQFDAFLENAGDDTVIVIADIHS